MPMMDVALMAFGYTFAKLYQTTRLVLLLFQKKKHNQFA